MVALWRGTPQGNHKDYYFDPPIDTYRPPLTSERCPRCDHEIMKEGADAMCIRCGYRESYFFSQPPLTELVEDIKIGRTPHLVLTTT